MLFKLNDFRKTGHKTNLRGIFGNYVMNFLTEFDLYIDTELIVYISKNSLF